MGFLDNLFISEEKESTGEKRLVDCVDKITNSDFGLFANIMDDLGAYINKVGNNEEPSRMMAYAYARRVAAAGLCAQGIWGQEEYDYTYNFFLSIQQNVAQQLGQLNYESTIKFQEDAAEQASELIMSYDSRFTREITMKIATVITEDASKAKSTGEFFNIDEIVDIFRK